MANQMKTPHPTRLAIDRLHAWKIGTEYLGNKEEIQEERRSISEGMFSTRNMERAL